MNELAQWVLILSLAGGVAWLAHGAYEDRIEEHRRRDVPFTWSQVKLTLMMIPVAAIALIVFVLTQK